MKLVECGSTITEGGDGASEISGSRGAGEAETSEEWLLLLVMKVSAVKGKGGESEPGKLDTQVMM